MNILVINGSPKHNGKISAIIKEILKGGAPSDQIEIIQLTNLTNLHHCTGCMNCQRTGNCIIRDDIVSIETAIKKSDMLILATPTHWGNMSGLMLSVFERLFGFLLEERQSGFPKARNAAGKKAILVTACSTPWPFSWIFNQSRSCFGRLYEICKYSGIKICGTFVLAGTAKMDEIPNKYLHKACKLGTKLFSIR
ncbi:MAG: iron-sulfur protein [Firmicutes bacterium]|nr:iron-sulfur protein [Bacillota bacterium]